MPTLLTLDGKIPTKRDYHPTSADIRVCAKCHQCCMPFPSRTSVVCPVCFHAVIRAATGARPLS